MRIVTILCFIVIAHTNVSAGVLDGSARRPISMNAQAPSLFDEVTSQRQKQAKASALLDETLASFPEKLILTQIPQQKPHILENRKNEVKAEWTVTIGFNMAEYYQNVAPKLARALATIAKRQPASVVSLAKPTRLQPGASASAVANPSLQIVAGDSKAPTPLQAIMDSANDGHLKDQREFLVALNTATSAGGDTLTWQFFVLDEDYYPAFAEYSRTKPTLRIRFLANDGKQIKDESLALRTFSINDNFWSAPWLVLSQWPSSSDGAYYLLGDSQENNSRRFVTIMPFIRGQGREYRDKFLMKYNATFTDSQIQRIAAVECSVVREKRSRISEIKVPFDLFREPLK